VLFVSVGCAAKVDRFTLDRVVKRAGAIDDLVMVCELGVSLAHGLRALPRNDPHRALISAETVAGVCAQQDAWEAGLSAARAQANLGQLGIVRAAEVTDATLAADRHHTLAAGRFERAWGHLVAQHPGIDTGTCPSIRSRDEVAVLLGLVSGTLALLHDRAAGGPLGVPLDRPLLVARGAACLEDARWWSTPSALQAGAWATVPGSAPEGVDPWALLDEAAARGDTSGTRVARAVQVLLASNAGRTADVEAGIRAFVAVPPASLDPEWVLLDRYAATLVLHQSDVLWTAHSGHRTEQLGTLPSDAAPAETGPDWFGGDDPFGSGVEEETAPPESAP